jgi:hypothetical protein
MRSSRRRGGILPLVAVLMVAVALCAGLVLDMSRAYAQKNEMQTAADAAALSGVIELIRDSTAVTLAANYYSGLNLVLHQAIPDASTDVICGTWSDISKFSPDERCGIAQDAVHFSAKDTARFTFPLLLGLATREMSVKATAWAPFVDATNCVKPWGLYYTLFTRALDPDNPDTLRALTESDLDRLRTLPPEALTFTLKTDRPNQPGNFGALGIPNSDVKSGSGADLYRENIADCTRDAVGVGSILDTETGNMPGPTKQGAAQLCNPLFLGTGSNAGCFRSPNGPRGVQVIAPLIIPDTDKEWGKYSVQVKALVAFSLDYVTQDGEVIGHFIPGIVGSGRISGTPSGVRTVILVE